MNDIEKLQNIIDESENIVFFGGAGVSTDSGLKDFRSPDGLYNMKFTSSPEEMLSSKKFYSDPDEFYRFYRTYMNCLDAKPNVTHEYLKYLEDTGKLKAIVTQNIDGLHTKAGNKNVYEIHGSIYRNYCTKCHKSFTADFIFSNNELPICPKCGDLIKPDVVLYGEMLPDCYDEAQKAIMKADCLIVAGSSLVVQPASSLVSLFHGKNLVIINNEETPYDFLAKLVIHDNISDVFSKLKRD